MAPVNPSGRLGRLPGAALTVRVAVLVVILGGIATTTSVSQPLLATVAATSPAVQQCNPPTFPTGKAYEVTCTVTVVNTITPEGATQSVVTTTACLAAAGVPYPSCPLDHGPVTTVTKSTTLVTSVNQCNGIANGGGSNVICSVTVTNEIVAGTTKAGVTVNQCIGSGTGGGSTVSCVPKGDTTSATVTECNGSATGGGTYAGQAAVKCRVAGGTTALPMKVNQCNGSATGGGSAVTCSTAFINALVSASVSTTTTTLPGTTTTTSPTGTSTGTSTPIPKGPPQTGAGGASHSGVNGPLVAVGGVALVGGVLATAQAFRRRRLMPARSDGPGSNEPDWE
jgi:hypothetical protein